MKRILIGALSAISLGFVGVAIADGIDEPIPSFYQEAGVPQNRATVSQLSNERIDPFTGKLQWHYVDITIPGNGGLDIKVQRSYSSLNEILGDPSPVGVGWTMHFGRVIRKSSVPICAIGQSPAFNAVLELPDGSRQVLYEEINGGGMIGTAHWRADCNAAPEGGLIVHSPDGTRYDMTTAGLPIGIGANAQSTWYVTRVADRNGNTLDFTYAIEGQIVFGVTAISSSDGRSVVFTYDGPNLKTVVAAGNTWTYSYTALSNGSGQFTLDKVTLPDTSTWEYQYNPPGTGPGLGIPGGYSLKKVTYPSGGVVDYTYSFVAMTPNTDVPTSTVVTKKESLEGTWTFTYQPATTRIPIGDNGGVVYTIDAAGTNTEFDKMTMTGPDGSTVYLHFGVESVGPGFVYIIGSLAGKYLTTEIGGESIVTQIEVYGWIPGVISNQPNQRPGNVPADSDTAMPLLADKKIARGDQIYETTMSNWDGFFNPQTIKETGSDTRTTQLTYFTDSTKWILHVKKDETIDTIPGSITRSFDLNGNLLTEMRYGVNTTFAYTPEGDLATRTDSNGKTTGYSNYSHGVPTSEAQPEGVIISRTVDDAGNIKTVRDGEGAMTSYFYDGLNRLKLIERPAGNSVAIFYQVNPSTTFKTVTRGDYTERNVYDGFARLIRVERTDAVTGQTVTQTYRNDSLGRRVFASYPNDNLGTGFVYDVLGRTLGIYNGSDGSLQTHSSTRVFSFNGADKVQVTNERGFTTTYTYRSYGDPDKRDLMQITAPIPAASVTMIRNGLGQLTKVTQNGLDRTYNYDTRYFLTSMTDPEVGTTTYGRDPVGNMTSRQVATAPAATYTYDGRNRVTNIVYAAGTPSVTRTYYKDDKLRSSDNGVAHHDYVYDANKNLTQETLTVGTQAPFTIGYAYNDNDALNVITYGSGKTITYAPDSFGRPTMAAPYVSAVSHHPNGQMATITYANGVTTTIGLNARKWPNTMSIAAGTTPITGQAYNYDEAGNVFTIQDTVDGNYNRSMDYDAIDRLTTANGGWGPGSIGYDGQGNILQQSLGGFSSNYTYDPATNRLATVSGNRNYTYSYDAYGNVIGNGVSTFVYNDASNMKCANCGQANETAYDYDAASMRVRATKGGVSTYFVHGANGSLLWEQVPGTSLTEYIYLHGKQVAVRAHSGG